MSDFKNFVSAEWLRDHLGESDLFVIDCRFDLFNPGAHGKEEYAKGFIEGAYYFDMDEDLSRNAGEHGGRRALPDTQELGAKLAACGMDMDSTIVCYDDGVYAATRAWWQLVYMGYRKVYVLDGGFKNWQEQGYPLGTEAPAPRGQGSFTACLHPEMYADVEDVKAVLGKPGVAIVDSRAYRRYSGEYEPLYSKKGHIPGALNVHYLSNMRNGEDERFIGTPEQWKRNFEACLAAEEIYLYCGSGIEAAINYMLLQELGVASKLYVGSMSDWVGYNDLEVEAC